MLNGKINGFRLGFSLNFGDLWTYGVYEGYNGLVHGFTNKAGGLTLYGFHSGAQSAKFVILQEDITDKNLNDDNHRIAHHHVNMAILAI